MSHDQNPDITVFAETNFRSQKRRFGIKRDDRRRHTYLIGKTGMGKSTILENMIIDDIIEGHGVGVVDPHGDLVEKVLDYIPSYRINDVVYVNPSDFDFPVAFNILESVDPRYKHLVASGLMGVFKKIWPDVWSARMEYILNNTLLALMDNPGSTMLAVNRMFGDKAFRAKAVERITDPVVKSFWVDQFANYSEKFAQEATAAIENKVGQFLSASVIRNIVGQVKSTINIRELMDQKKIVLMNLSKGRIGEDNSRLLGGMLITKIQLAAMERVDTPEKDRQDFYLYVDEFQNFATDSFANILSEARKYRLNLIVAHQYIEQLEETVRAAVFGNVGTLIAFRVGAADAEFLEKEFTPRFTVEDLVNIPKFNIYLKLMVDGVATDPFSAVGLPPWSEEEKTGNREKVIQASRERYAQSREIVEEKISRWAETKDLARAAAPRAGMASRPGGSSGGAGAGATVSAAPPKTHPAVCSRCGKTVMLNFVPDGKRPVYCDECFKLVRDGVVPPVELPKPTPVQNTTPAPSIPKSVNPISAPRSASPQPAVSLDALRTAPATPFTRNKPSAPGSGQRSATGQNNGRTGSGQRRPQSGGGQRDVRPESEQSAPPTQA